MNNKGLNNIVLVVLIILIVIVGVTLIWSYVGNTLHKEGKSIEEASSIANVKGKLTGDSGDDNDSVINDANKECKILNVYWFSNNSEVNKVVEGEDVSLVAIGGENCEGKTIKFSIWESDGCFWGWCLDELAENYSVEFDEGDTIADVGWKAELKFDGLTGGYPEYYFIVKVGDGDERKSGLLNVEKAKGANSPPSGECKSIYYFGDKRIDIVIFADEKTAKDYADATLGFYPLSEYKNAFNFYYIDDYPTKDACEIYGGIALLCKSPGLITRASLCPNDYIMVVQKHEPNIRSSAYSKIMSINSALPMSVVQHEFGHVFASLAEEYVPAQIPKKAKNCAKNVKTPEEDCNKQFGSIVGTDRDGCYVECSKDDYRRSIEAGVMRTLSSNRYGLFNDRLIVERLKESADLSDIPIAEQNVQNTQNSQSASLSPPSCANQEYYLVKAKVNPERNALSLDRVSVQEGCVDENSNGYGGDKLEVLDEDTNEVIQETNFNSELIFTDGNDKLVNGEKVIDGLTIENIEPVYLKVPIKIKGEEVKKVRTRLGENKEKYYKIEFQGAGKNRKIMEVAY